MGILLQEFNEGLQNIAGSLFNIGEKMGMYADDFSRMNKNP